MADARPNILLILTDQQRGDCLGIEGHPVLQTPNLDWLARSGTRFRRAYAECPSCIAARRTIMTGQAPAVHGMVGFQDGVEWSPCHTLAGELSRAGYRTEMIGKLHLFPQRKRYGFHHLWLSDATHTEENNDYLAWLNKDGNFPPEYGVAHGVSANGWVGRPTHLPEEKTHTFWCMSKAIEFLTKRDPKAPFFLNVSLIDPHPPLTPPRFYYDRYIARKLPRPVVGDWAPKFDGPQRGLNPDASIVCLDDETMRCCRAAYYGMINFIDDQIGRLVHVLMRQRLLRNTFILFASDHGEMLGDHHLFRKTFAYEASARVPFLVRAPLGWNLPGDIVSSAPVGLQDIMPTLLDAAGVPIPETVTGRSVLPLMRGEKPAWREFIHGEHAGCYRNEDGNHLVTDGRRKYIWHSQTGREQLFVLDRDPEELRDLARTKQGKRLLPPWRARLVQTLRGRPEGFTDGRKLIAGRPHEQLVPGHPASS